MAVSSLMAEAGWQQNAALLDPSRSQRFSRFPHQPKQPWIQTQPDWCDSYRRCPFIYTMPASGWTRNPAYI